MIWHHLAGVAHITGGVAAGGGSGGTLDVNVISPFLNLGLAGVVVLMVVFRKGLVPEWALRDAEQRIERLEAANTALSGKLEASTNLMVEQVVPLMTRAVDVESKYLDQMQQEGRDERGDRPARPPRGR